MTTAKGSYGNCSICGKPIKDIMDHVFDWITVDVSHSQCIEKRDNKKEYHNESSNTMNNALEQSILDRLDTLEKQVRSIKRNKRPYNKTKARTKERYTPQAYCKAFDVDFHHVIDVLSDRSVLKYENDEFVPFEGVDAVTTRNKKGELLVSLPLSIYKKYL